MRGSSDPVPVAKRASEWRIRGGALPLGAKTLVMGIVNVTPDSFSDGGQFLDPERAVGHARQLVAEGADILDIGGESTRPGSEPVSEQEELRRVVPVIEAVAGEGVPISIDTRKAAVAEAAIEAGAAIVNDVSSLRDPHMVEAVAKSGAGVVLMHMLGEPKTMQNDIRYADVAREVRDYLQGRAAYAETHGVARDSIVLDPGLGFGKRSGKGVEDNSVLLRRLPELVAAGYPVLVGASRKSFIGNALRLPLVDRLEGSLAAAVLAAWQGASILRVHDVKPTRRALDLVDAVRRA